MKSSYRTLWVIILSVIILIMSFGGKSEEGDNGASSAKQTKSIDLEKWEEFAIKIVREYKRDVNTIIEMVAFAIQYGDENGIDPLLVLAIIATESSFRVNVTSFAGAIGAMQIKLSTAKMIDPTITAEKLMKPETNIKIGCELLARLGRLLDKNSSYLDAEMRTKLINAAWHAGENSSAITGRLIPDIPQTQNHVRKVMEKYAQFKVYFSSDK